MGWVEFLFIHSILRKLVNLFPFNISLLCGLLHFLLPRFLFLVSPIVSYIFLVILPSGVLIMRLKYPNSILIIFLTQVLIHLWRFPFTLNLSVAFLLFKFKIVSNIIFHWLPLYNNTVFARNSYHEDFTENHKRQLEW